MKYEFVNNVHYESEDGCYVLIDFNNSKFYEMNASSSIILNGIKDNKSLDDIAQDIFQKYDVEINKAKQDVCDFINKLIDNNLVNGIE